MNGDVLVRIHEVSKQFPGVKALDRVSFDVIKGDIHAIVGENGAGKSTLINIMSGVQYANEGNIYFRGEKLLLTHPMQAAKKGIAVVHQELNMVKDLNVVENIFLGHLQTKRIMGVPVVDKMGMRLQAEKLLDSLGVKIDVMAKTRKLSVSKQQIVEICKALIYDAELIIMDEPSATLTEKELHVLFGIIKMLKAKGVTIIYISHRLEEIFELADKVTVMRDGRHVKTCPVCCLTKQQLITAMVGRELASEYPKQPSSIGTPALEVRGLCHKKLGLKDISFTANKGEILGIAGLVGAGRTELAKCIFGAYRRDAGEIFLEGKPVKIANVRDAIKKSIALMPEDRKTDGIILGMQVQHNISMVGIKRILHGGILSRRAERALALGYVDTLSIRVPDVYRLTRNLSGGNQQKVVLAKWLAVQASVLIFDEPTRGIDVGAKAEIYRLLSDLAVQGKCIIMISSEMPELMGMCDRMLIMHEGHISGELKRNEFSQEGIMQLMVDAVS
ncbi:MAG: sugar ABC transporter ATP-binding protein [Eubacteriales bacterium]|nr:sugar ABC transporter ATP-binding protein [Eubacteriales bacterium]